MAIRSESSRRAVLDATMDLLVRDGRRAITVQQLSIEAIAKRAKVSKATIYRWWPGKAAVVIDAFMESHVANTRIREDLPVRDALLAHLKALISRFTGPEGRLIRQIIAEAQYDPATLNVVRTQIWDDRHAAVEKLMQRGIDEGAFRADLDPGAAAALFYAPVLVYLLLDVEPLDASLAERLTDLGIRGLTPLSRAEQSARE